MSYGDVPDTAFRQMGGDEPIPLEFEHQLVSSDLQAELDDARSRGGGWEGAFRVTIPNDDPYHIQRLKD